MHTYVHVYIHTCMHIYVHTYIQLRYHDVIWPFTCAVCNKYHYLQQCICGVSLSQIWLTHARNGSFCPSEFEGPASYEATYRCVCTTARVHVHVCVHTRCTEGMRMHAWMSLYVHTHTWSFICAHTYVNIDVQISKVPAGTCTGKYTYVYTYEFTYLCTCHAYTCIYIGTPHACRCILYILYIEYIIHYI